MSTKEEIFKYVMESPENTNPSVLGSLLNNLEDGGSASPFIVTFTYDESSTKFFCDKSLQEILAAYDSNKIIIGRSSEDGVVLQSVEIGLILVEDSRGIYFNFLTASRESKDGGVTFYDALNMTSLVIISESSVDLIIPQYFSVVSGWAKN